MKKNIYLLLFLTIISCQSIDIQIFNGNDLKGWVNYGGGKFYVEDECIVAEAIMGLPNSFLYTEKKYQNFELEFELVAAGRERGKSVCNVSCCRRLSQDNYNLGLNFIALSDSDERRVTEFINKMAT